MTKILKEDWLDNELKKVQHVWMKKGPDGNFLWDKRKKMNWIDKIDVKADRQGMSDYEIQQALSDYGIGYNLKWYTKDGGYSPEGEKQGLLQVTEKYKDDWVEAEVMNRYVNTISMDHTKNIWSEAAKRGTDPEPVKGKTFTNKPQVKVQINPIAREH